MKEKVATVPEKLNLVDYGGKLVTGEKVFSECDQQDDWSIFEYRNPGFLPWLIETVTFRRFAKRVSMKPGEVAAVFSEKPNL